MDIKKDLRLFGWKRRDEGKGNLNAVSYAMDIDNQAVRFLRKKLSTQ